MEYNKKSEEIMEERVSSVFNRHSYDYNTLDTHQQCYYADGNRTDLYKKAYKYTSREWLFGQGEGKYYFYVRFSSNNFWLITYYQKNWDKSRKIFSHIKINKDLALNIAINVMTKSSVIDSEYPGTLYHL